MLKIRLLGEFAIIRDGETLTLPRSRKTLALLAFLIMTNRRYSRDKLCSLLWELPNDPRGALRWSLSKLRALVDMDEHRRIIGERNYVSFDSTDVEVDANALRIASEQGFDEIPLDILRSMAQEYEGEFLENLELPECQEFQAWRTGEQSQLAQLQADLLVTIIKKLKSDEQSQNHNRWKLEELTRSFPEISIASRSQFGDPLVELGVRNTNGLIPLPDKPSIVVLPFTNLSGQPDQDYFVDGLSDDIITALAKFSMFFVIARNTSYTYKGKLLDTKKIGLELGVQYILEGSARKIGGRVRITTQFVAAATGRNIWAERYEREIGDIFAVQDEITTKISTTVGKELLNTEMTRAHQGDNRDVNAHEYFLRGFWHYAQYKADNNRKALKIAEGGVKEFPNQAELHALVSLSALIDFIYGWNRDRINSLTGAMASAQRAVELDKSNPLCYRCLGDALLYAKRHEEAIRTLERGLALNQNDADSFMVLGGALGYAGNFDKAVENIRLAARLSPRDPFSVLFYHFMAHSAMVAGHNDMALKWAFKVKEEKPTFPGGYRIGAVMLALTGRVEEAKSDLETYLKFAPNTTIEDLREVLPIKHDTDMDRYLGALRLAGMPE
jgi:TolB-like protein